jgi:hypothetical protein
MTERNALNLDLDDDLPAARPLRDCGIKILLKLAELHALKKHGDFAIHFVAGRYHLTFGPSSRRVFPDEGHSQLRQALIEGLRPMVEED